MIDANSLKIEAGIKIPDYTVAGKIKSMKVGDSVFFKSFGAAKSFYMRIHQLGFKSCNKKVKGGSRVWKMS